MTKRAPYNSEAPCFASTHMERHGTVGKGNSVKHAKERKSRKPPLGTIGKERPSFAKMLASMPNVGLDADFSRSDVAGDAVAIISHITPAGGNVFLDLGFPAEEAEQLKMESVRRIAQTEERASQKWRERHTREAGGDHDSSRVIDHRNVQE